MAFIPPVTAGCYSQQILANNAEYSFVPLVKIAGDETFSLRSSSATPSLSCTIPAHFINQDIATSKAPTLCSPTKCEPATILLTPLVGRSDSSKDLPVVLVLDGLLAREKDPLLVGLVTSPSPSSSTTSLSDGSVLEISSLDHARNNKNPASTAVAAAAAAYIDGYDNTFI